MSFLITFLHNELEKIGMASEPVITKTIIEIINNKSDEISNDIIKRFIETIKTDINVNKNQKIKLLAVVKDAMKKDKTINLYDEIEALRLENTNLKTKLNQLQNSVKQKKNTVNKVVGGNPTNSNTNNNTDANTNTNTNADANTYTNTNTNTNSDINTAATTTAKTIPVANLVEFEGAVNQLVNVSNTGHAITDAENEMNEYMSKMKDTIAGGGLMKIVVDIIVKLSTEKIEIGICKTLNNHKKKIVDSVIRTFVNQIENDADINDIEVGEIYKIIETKLKKMDIEQLKKTKKSTFNKFKAGFGNEYNKIKKGFSKTFEKNVGGKRNTHRKKSKKLNRKTRRKRL